MGQCYSEPTPEVCEEPAADTAEAETSSSSTDDQDTLGNAEVQSRMDSEENYDEETGQCVDPSVGETQVSEEEATPQEEKEAAPEIDPEQAADRAKAAEELREKFDVVPNDYQGARDPNTLTEEEYADVCATYSDVRLGKGDLQVEAGENMTDAEKEEFKNKTMDDISTIMQTEEGRAVVNRLNDNAVGEEVDENGDPVHHTTTIKPGSQNAPNCEPEKGEDDPNASNRQGANAEVSYAPGLPSMPTYAVQEDWAKAMRSDVTLFHELNHAVTTTAGEFDTEPVAEESKVAGDRGRGPIAGDEYAAAGLGGYEANVDGVPTSENSYRDARARINVGAKEDDQSLPYRENYKPTRAPDY